MLGEFNISQWTVSDEKDRVMERDHHEAYATLILDADTRKVLWVGHGQARGK